ncbi:MAG: heavy metal translocating P-type ATPase [Desulfovibrio sp.]|nr:heavy metal translocating P-type ATPase [Desulfovibrio sp.]
MDFIVVHEIEGLFSDGETVCRGRMRCRSGRRLSMDEAEFLASAMDTVDGVLGVSVNPRIGSVLFFYRDRAARLAALRRLSAAGRELDEGRRTPGWSLDCLPSSGGVGGVAFSLARFFLLRNFMPLWWSVGMALLHAVPCLWHGVADLAKGRLSVSVLDASAVATCLLRRDFRTARTLTVLLSAGGELEEWTRQKALASLTESLSVAADAVWIAAPDGTERVVRLSDVQEGDVVIVRAGTSIPVDGVVASGEAVVNQASMTGEPIGVSRGPGETVFAGTVVEEGELRIRTVKVAGETRLRQIAAFIEASETLKAGVQARYERMADMAVPFTFGLAGLVWLFTRNLVRASSVLLVDYSCALKLTTPLAVLAGMREGAQNGVVVKGGRFFEALRDVDTVVCDKTGTLTNAEPRVAEIVAVDGFEPGDVLRAMACLEEHFPHPVARAVVRAAEERGLGHPEEHGEVQYVVAHGVASLLHGKKVVVGSRHYLECDEGVDLSQLDAAVETQIALGRSLLYVAVGGRAAGLLAIEDPPRPEAPQVVQALKDIGVSRIVMMTGDDERTAKAVAERLGIAEYRAQVLPKDKADVVAGLEAEGRCVLMVGDGVNDAPALSASSVGVAMCDGTDLARGVANVLLTRPSLDGLVTAKLLGTRVMARIHSNFVCTMLFNSLFLAGGVFQLLSPSASAFLHNMTTMALAARAMRRTLRPGEAGTAQA